MTTETAHHEAHSEKQHAALSSLFWALFLTLIKLGAGLATNSLGILSEALHSSLDLVAAGITFFAVRVAARPADETHPYGYGKIENLSALAETVLLLVTCGWIVHEAVNRLFFDAPEITPSWWGVIIILISLLVDVNRAAMLRRVAQKHKSQALEADALHLVLRSRARRPALRAGQRIPSGGQPLPEHFAYGGRHRRAVRFGHRRRCGLPALPPGRDHAA